MRHIWHRLRFWICWPALFAYFYGSHRTRIIVVDGGRVLLVKDRSKVWFDDDRWAVPGGGMHRQETPAQGAARELQEELGIIAPETAFEELWQGKLREYGLAYTAHFLLLHASSSINLKLQPSEIAHVEWLYIKDLHPNQLKLEARMALELLADH